MELPRCTNCILPANYPGISFNDEGICNFCLTKQVKRAYKGKKALDDTIRPFLNGSRYDCIIGLSGGRDSSYLLHYAVKKLHLNVLAYTFDNGFMPDQTRDNISNIVKKLKVDHVFDQRHHTEKCITPFLKAWARKPSAAMLSSMCVGCRLDMILGFLQAAKKYETPLLITGGGEPESSFAMRYFTNSADDEMKVIPLMSGYASELIQNPRYLMSPTFITTTAAEYIVCFAAFPLMRKIIYPQQKYVPFYRYVPWEEDEIMSVITNELGWSNYSYSASTWRSDCKISLLKNYLYEKTVGFTKNDEILSGMIRNKLLSREKALERVVVENVIPEDFVKEFTGEIGIEYESLAGINRVA